MQEETVSLSEYVLATAAPADEGMPVEIDIGAVLGKLQEVGQKEKQKAVAVVHTIHGKAQTIIAGVEEGAWREAAEIQRRQQEQEEAHHREKEQAAAEAVAAELQSQQEAQQARQQELAQAAAEEEARQRVASVARQQAQTEVSFPPEQPGVAI